MRKILSVLVVVIFSITYSSTIYAASTSDAEAQELKTLISGHMAKLKSMYGNVPDITLEYEGEVSVSPKGSYYKVLLPSIAFGVSNPNNPADAFNMLLDPVAVNVSKQGDDAWSMSVAIPMPIKATNGNDDVIFNINVGEQSASIFFIPSLATAPKYNISYKNITVESLKGEKLQINIGELYSKLTLSENAQGLWSGPAKAEIKNINVISDDLNMDIDSIKIGGSYTDFDLKTMALFSEKVLGMDLSSGSIPDDEAQDFFKNSFSSMFTSIGGMSAETSINGVKGSYIDPKTDKTADFALAKLALGFEANGIRKDSASLGFSFAINGITTSDIHPDIQGIIPTIAELKIRIEKLPIQSLLKMFQEVLNNNGDPSQGSMGAIGLLSKAGTTLVIDKNNLETREFGLTSYGEVTANDQAAMKAIADFTLKLRNLDAVIAKYSQSEVTPAGVKQALGIAPMIQMMGAQETGANGDPVRSYHLQLMEDGKMLLNGSDLGPMLQMGKKPMQQQPEPTPQ